MKKQTKKLVLARETVQALKPVALQNVKGALLMTDWGCGPWSAEECN